MNVLAIDVGTSSVKAAVLDSATTMPISEIGRGAYELDRPSPEAAEIPLDRLWSAVSTAVREAQRGHVPKIEGIGFSCMMPTLVLLDENFAPLGPALTHLDRRARSAAAAVWKEVGREFHEQLGNLPLPGGISALAYRAFLEREPESRGRVAHYLHLNSWLGWRLTGGLAMDTANAAFTGLCESLKESHSWSPRWCHYFGVDNAWLPRIVAGDEVVGNLSDAIAKEWSLPSGIPVKIGTADTSSALLASGLKKGELLHSAGTTQVLAVIADPPSPGPKRLVRPLGVGKAFLHVTHNPLCGASLDWLHDICFAGQTATEFYESTIDEALSHSTTVLLDPPFLGGDRLEMETREASFQKLTLSTTPVDLLSALLSAMRNGHHKAIAELGVGPVFSRIHLTGGAASVVFRLLPEYQSDKVVCFEEGSLRGVARLF